MKRIHFYVALVAGIWTVAVGGLNPIPVGDRAQAIAFATRTARELWRDIHVPTAVRVRDDAGNWRDEKRFGDDRPTA